MKHLIKGKDYVGVVDDPEEQEHKLWREKGFKPAPEGWSPPEAEPEEGALGEEPDEPDYSAMSRVELEASVEERGLEVEGSGSGGNVLMVDLVDALMDDDEV